MAGSQIESPNCPHNSSHCKIGFDRIVLERSVGQGARATASEPQRATEPAGTDELDSTSIRLTGRRGMWRGGNPYPINLRGPEGFMHL